MVEYVETRVDKKLELKKDELATKVDLANLKADIIKQMDVPLLDRPARFPDRHFADIF